MGKYKEKISKTVIAARYMNLAEEFMTNKMKGHDSDITHQEIHKLAGYFQQIFEEGMEQKRNEVVDKLLINIGLR
jgi:hypothetical protein